MTLTLDIPVDDAVLMEDIDGYGDLFAVKPDDMLLQPQSGHLLQSALVTVLHEDVHLLLRVSTWTFKAHCLHMQHVTSWSDASYPVKLDSKVSHQVWVFNAFEYFQLVRSLLDCFVVVWLESDLIGGKTTTKKREKCTLFSGVTTICLKLLNSICWTTYLLHGHQLTSVNIDAGIHLPILALTCDQTQKHHQSLFEY